MTPYWKSEHATLLHGDVRECLRQLEEASVDSLVTDPPAGIEFMGKEWDTFRGGRRSRGWACGGTTGNDGYGGFAKTLRPAFCSQTREDRDNFIAFMAEAAAECLRVLKPGAHALVWALPRTSHWTATALEDAGFEIRDVVTHHYGSGFPKSLDVSKAIDRAAGAEGTWEAVDHPGRPGKRTRDGSNISQTNHATSENPDGIRHLYRPASPEAQQWEGWGTALKPASEHWILCRKLVSERNVAANVLKHGTGALNIEDCRVPLNGEVIQTTQGGRDGGGFDPGSSDGTRHDEFTNTKGRWPANLVLSCECDGDHAEGCPVRLLDEQSGDTRSVYSETPQPIKTSKGIKGGAFGHPDARHPDGHTTSDSHIRGGYTDHGGASRFFYVAKPSRGEKENGVGAANPHPT